MSIIIIIKAREPSAETLRKLQAAALAATSPVTPNLVERKN